MIWRPGYGRRDVFKKVKFSLVLLFMKSSPLKQQGRSQASCWFGCLIYRNLLQSGAATSLEEQCTSLRDIFDTTFEPSKSPYFSNPSSHLTGSDLAPTGGALSLSFPVHVILLPSEGGRACTVLCGVNSTPSSTRDF